MLLDVISYTSEIIAGEKGGQWQQALGLLQECDTMFFLVDVISYSSAIIACEKGRKWKHAFGLLAKMRDNDHACVEIKSMSIDFMCILSRNKAYIAATSFACLKYSAFLQLIMVRTSAIIA